MMYALDWNEPPQRAMALGGILPLERRPQHAGRPRVLFEYGDIPVYMRLNLGSESPEVVRFQGSKGISSSTEYGLSYLPQPGVDTLPATTPLSFPRAMREEYVSSMACRTRSRARQRAAGGRRQLRGNRLRRRAAAPGEVLQRGAKSRKPVMEDAVFGNHAALACHMANESYFRGAPSYSIPPPTR